MSTDQRNTTDSRTLTELREMSEIEARQSLTMAEYEKWEALNEKLDEHEEALERWEETREDATDIMIRADVGDLEDTTTIFGNDVSVYYALDDDRIQEQSERLMDVFGVDDPEEIAGDKDAAEQITVDDLDRSEEEVVEEAKDVLGELVVVSIQSWNGTDWEELSEDQQRAIKNTITDDPPEGWGVSGLMDAWSEIQLTVERNRDERLERIQKFRDPERRGDR